MSDIKNLLEKMDAMSSAERKPTGPKWPGYLKGTDSAKKTRGRMVGDGAAESVEESESFLKELTQVINSNPVKRDLFREWSEFKEGFNDSVRSAADKIVAAGSATRDALSGVVDAIPRPFDEKTYQDRVVKNPENKADWRTTDKKVKPTSNNEGKETPATYNKDSKTKKSNDEYRPGVTTDSPSKHPTKTDIPKRELPKNTSTVVGESEPADSEEGEEVTVVMKRPANVTDYDKIQFIHRFKDGREEPVPHGSYYHDKWYRTFTGKETPMTQELIKGLQAPVKRGKEFIPQEPDTVQDIKIPGQDKGRYRAPLPNWQETDGPITEYGAPGSGISGEPGAAEDKAQKDQTRAGKQQARDQVTGLVAQLQGARAELAGLNKQFPQGANPVEKAMSLQQMAGQKIGIKKNIENLSAQIAALRQQAI